MKYFLILEGHDLYHPDGHLLGTGGDVIPLATDAKVKSERRAAEAVLRGNYNIVLEVTKPGKAPKKKATYKTKDATPEG